jgi:hypothetical protein
MRRSITERGTDKGVVYNLNAPSDRVQESVILSLKQLLQAMQAVPAALAYNNNLQQWQDYIRQHLSKDAYVAVCHVPAAVLGKEGGKQEQQQSQASSSSSNSSSRNSSKLAVMLPVWYAFLGRAPLQNSHYEAGEAVAIGCFADSGLWAHLKQRPGCEAGHVAMVDGLNRKSVGLAFSRDQLQQVFSPKGLLHILRKGGRLNVMSPQDMPPPHMMPAQRGQ